MLPFWLKGHSLHLLFYALTFLISLPPTPLFYNSNFSFPDHIYVIRSNYIEHHPDPAIRWHIRLRFTMLGVSQVSHSAYPRSSVNIRRIRPFRKAFCLIHPSIRTTHPCRQFLISAAFAFCILGASLRFNHVNNHRWNFMRFKFTGERCSLSFSV